MTGERRPVGRRTFAPVLAVGVGGGVLAAVSSNKPWAQGEGGLTHSALATGDAGVSPLAGALALVVLACWGVVLVTRGGFRRAVTWLGAVASVAFAASVVWGRWTVIDAVRDDLARTVGSSAGPVTHTAWWWWALLAAALVGVASLAAVAFADEWPEMGSRYDAPAGASAEDAAVPDTNLDIWKALDEGRDPTA